MEVIKEIPDESIDCIITSPPYFQLRDYGTAIWEGGNNAECNHKIPDYEKDNKNKLSGSHISRYNKINCYKCGAKRIDNQIGLESSREQYINNLCNLFDECKRILKKYGTVWVNIGDTYAGGISGQGGNSSKHEETDTNKYSKSTRFKGMKKTYDTNKQLKVKFSKRKRYCCECGKEFEALPNQYFCGHACSGVDNTPREVKGVTKDKCLMQIPSRFAIEMCNRGWILRNEIIWHKPNAMPSSIKDRFTVDFEKVFFFVKNKKYWFEQQFESLSAISIKDIKNRKNMNRLTGENGSKHFGKDNNYEGKGRFRTEYYDLENVRNKRCVWSINTKPFKESHYAVYPQDLILPMIKAGCPEYICNKCGFDCKKIYDIKNIGNIISDKNKARDVRGTGVSSKTTLGSFSTINFIENRNCGCNSEFLSGIILDPFMGSGTTAVACERLNRRWIGIELSPEYCKIANERIKQEQKQLKLFKEV